MWLNAGNEALVEERLSVPWDPDSTLTLHIILCGIQVKGEYGWRWFVLDGRRAFTGYSTVMPSNGWRSGFLPSGRAKWLAAGRVVDLSHSTRCHDGWYAVPFH
ncbi:hypothetical protein Hanom_Chr01g00010911 [Helianthus anomalus]